jgi:hypothetical protein
MRENLFSTIRTCEGNTFGVVVWKIELVPIQPTVTFFNVTGTLEKKATKLFHRWQYVADKFHEDIFSRIFIRRISSDREGTVKILMNLYRK